MPLDNELPRSRLTSLIEREAAKARAAAIEDRWHKEGWRECKECEGEGRIESFYSSGSYQCRECGGSGEVKMPFYDWLDGLDEGEAVRVPVPPVGEVE